MAAKTYTVRTFLVGFFLIVSTALSGQNVELDGRFGIHVFRPVVLGPSVYRPKFSHNFWISLNLRKKFSPNSALNFTLSTNGISMRFHGVDSPKTTFLTMNYLGFMVSQEWILNKQFSLLAGIEPKVYITGHEYTADPDITRRIQFQTNKGPYNRYSLGLNMGMCYRLGPIKYTLRYSFDPSPFKSYTQYRIFEQKVSFGFTFFPII